MKSKRLVQIIFYNNPDGYPPIVNGVRLLAEAGWQVELLSRQTLENWGVSYPSMARVLRFGTNKRRSWQEYAAFIMRVLRYGSRHASVIYAHDMHALVPARILATMYGRPLIYHSHDFADDIQLLPSSIRPIYQFQLKFARSADLIVIPDAGRAKVISRTLRLQSEPLIVANAPLKRPVVSSEILRYAIEKKGRRFDKVVFRQGRVGIGHAIETTLHSLPYWKERSWGFAVMGLSESSYIDKLMLEARAIGVEDQFVVLPPVGYDQVCAFTAGADLGHALYEPIHINNVHITTASNKIMEYMEAGLPLLVSDTPTLRAHVEKYKCGLVADEQSSESIAASVNSLLGDPERAATMGTAARRAFDEVFCYERQFAPVIEAFQRLI